MAQDVASLGYRVSWADVVDQCGHDDCWVEIGEFNLLCKLG